MVMLLVLRFVFEGFQIGKLQPLEGLELDLKQDDEFFMMLF